MQQLTEPKYKYTNSYTQEITALMAPTTGR